MIGVLGGYGAVGLQVARLIGVRHGGLRLGGRAPERARSSVQRLAAGAELLQVDIEQPASLRAFMDGCAVVVNCAGPSSRLASIVAREGRRLGVHVVDAGSDQELVALAGCELDVSLIFAAGALPGLSGLLPLWLAKRFDRVQELQLYAGVLDRFSAIGAEDYLAGVLGGATRAGHAWHAGGEQARALGRRSQVMLPFFPREVTLLPYLDDEAREVARQLALAEGRWHIALDGEHLVAALDAARDSSRRAAVEHLCRASALDVAGREPYVRLLLQLDGMAGGRGVTRTALLHAPGIDVLTGASAAAVALAVLRGGVPRRALPAAALHPELVMELLQTLPARCEVTVFDAAIAELRDEVAGQL